MKKTKVLFLFFVSHFTLNAQVLDLESCLKMADTANLSIRNARLDIAINQNEGSTVFS